jgi:hypothetical protein
MDEQQPHFAVGTDLPQRERFRICEVPRRPALLHIVVLLMPSHPTRFLPTLMLQNCCAVMAAQWSVAGNVSE